ncbi:hypothetical protein WR25_02359 [Diploscapter pachys]|uniref:Uncharacterized protein n=1 Tax=Diploscapter pachys TaxID=2018661 RepID=A0A2A2K001_9BILA|nr:hypothetical protein WR25_02359 [Diploscapter pachys]
MFRDHLDGRFNEILSAFFCAYPSHSAFSLVGIAPTAGAGVGGDECYRKVIACSMRWVDGAVCVRTLAAGMWSLPVTNAERWISLRSRRPREGYKKPRSNDLIK